MKKFFCILLAFTLLATVCLTMASCTGDKELAKIRKQLEGKLEGDYKNDLKGTTLYVYNWGEYMSDGEDDSLDLNRAFEAITGIHVEYETYASNEAMYAKLSGGGVSYDIVIPSDYMVARLIAEDRVQKLDFKKLTNYKYIDEQYKKPGYDPTGEYSIPYAGGYFGVIYNNTMVSEEDVAAQSWDLLWNEKYKGHVCGIDNARDALAIALLASGYDVNTTNRAEWDAAAEKLKSLVPSLQGWYMDQVFEKMEGGNAAIATYYAGDYLTMREDREEATGNGDDLSFYMPKEGTNIFFDAMCVMKDSKNYEAAMLYLNFMMEPYIAWQNAEYIRYTCPNTAVVNNPEYSLKDEECLYPENASEIKATYYTNLDEATIKYYEDLFNKIKAKAGK